MVGEVGMVGGGLVKGKMVGDGGRVGVIGWWLAGA
jgi:hypothetical protein